MAPAAARRHHEVVSLFWRVFAINAVVLVAAVAVLALSPATVSERIHAGEQLAVLAIGVAVVLAVNLLALRRVFGPLEQPDVADAPRRTRSPPGSGSRSSARRPRSPSSATRSTTCSACATACSSPATPSAAGWSSREMGSSAHGSAHAPHLGSISAPVRPGGEPWGFLVTLSAADDEPEEQTCPKCRMPAPVAAEECPECGWDLRRGLPPRSYRAASMTEPAIAATAPGGLSPG